MNENKIYSAALTTEQHVEIEIIKKTSLKYVEYEDVQNKSCDNKKNFFLSVIIFQFPLWSLQSTPPRGGRAPGL